MESPRIIKRVAEELHALAKRGLNGAAAGGMLIGIIAFLLASGLIISHLYNKKKRKNSAPADEDLEMGNRAAGPAPVLTIQVPTPDASSVNLTDPSPSTGISTSTSGTESRPKPEVLQVGKYGSAWSPLTHTAAGAVPADPSKLNTLTTASHAQPVSGINDTTCPGSETETQAVDEPTQNAAPSDDKPNPPSPTASSAEPSIKTPEKVAIKPTNKPSGATVRTRSAAVKPSPTRATGNTAAFSHPTRRDSGAGPSFARPTRSSGFASPTAASASKDTSNSKPTGTSSRKPISAANTATAAKTARKPISKPGSKPSGTTRNGPAK